ncbi:UNVERIFIED_CONTAM: hypothetical protein Slati_2635700 [Sesamum latifolium]|uniref:RNase H type-1 domain-containing protein n=1 Tax=Sesamum latifolium TaxID=2727402 RepID=A0AAW2VTG1_9LAMI
MDSTYQEWIKLNSGGASKGNSGPTWGGGVFGDELGRGFFAYYLFSGTATNNFAEIAAVVRGLELAWERGFYQDKVEVDSSNLANYQRGAKQDPRASGSSRAGSQFLITLDRRFPNFRF